MDTYPLLSLSTCWKFFLSFGPYFSRDAACRIAVSDFSSFSLVVLRMNEEKQVTLNRDKLDMCQSIKHRFHIICHMDHIKYDVKLNWHHKS